MRRSILPLLLLFSLHVAAQKTAVWKGKKCAVVLTYDDALSQHLDYAIPLLDSLGLKATFYLTVGFPGFRDHVTEWRKVAAHGHELGNHTTFHPCNGNRPGREWVNPNYDLSNYSMQRITDEIRLTNTMLFALDGKKERTFAFPCADTRVHDSTYFDAVKNDFIAARNVRGEMLPIEKINLNDIGCYMINNNSSDEMIALVNQAMEKHTLLVFLFHGVNGGNSLNVSTENHRRLLQFLKAHRKDIWITTMRDAATHIKQYQTSNTK